MEKLPLNQELGSFELTTVIRMTKSTWNIPLFFSYQKFLCQKELGISLF